MIAYLSLLIPGLLGISIILLIHEFGHYIASRILKVDVDIFSFGIGPKLISIQGRNTEFRISMIPFGGYCRMKGDTDLSKALNDRKKSIDVTEKGSYFSVSPWKRFIIYLCGPLTNFILSVILIAITASIPVEHLSDRAYIAPISDYPSIFPSGIVQSSVEKGDLVLSSGNTEFADYQDLEAFLRDMKGTAVSLKVLRDGEIIDVELQPIKNGDDYTFGITNVQKAVIGRSVDSQIKEGDQIIRADGIEVDNTLDLYSIGKKDFDITLLRDGKEYEYSIKDGVLPFAWRSDIRIYGDADNQLLYALKKTSDMFRTTLSALGAIFSFDLDGAKTVITGPMKAASTFGEISTLAFQTSNQSGIRSVLYLLAIVSISICVGNLLPIPTFDGGQILITLAEAIRRDTLKPKAYLFLQAAGMIVGYLIIISMYLIDILHII